MIENWLDTLSSMIGQNLWLAPLLALFAGVLTSITPCALSNVPLVIGYVGGTGQKDTKRAFWLSLTFSAGTAVTFTVLGVAASAAGKPDGGFGRLVEYPAGSVDGPYGIADLGDI